MGFKITGIEPGSIAEEIGMEPGDVLKSINENEIKDRIDYVYHVSDEYIELEIERDGEIFIFEIEKEYDEELGLEFSNPLMDEAKRCNNRCVFCFVDQNPKGMREPLYFKDDDSRLSFIHGNFVTLTNVSYEQLQRIIDYRIYPINVSVHATDSEARIRMLGNRKSGDIMDKLRFFADGEVEMNGQIVLVKGYNDGEVLEKTIDELMQFYPHMNSVAVVPVGVTRYREGLAEISPFEPDESGAVLNLISRLQEKCLQTIGTRFVFPSDEFFISAGSEIPESDYYEGYIQEENGVGLIRKLLDDISRSIELLDGLEAKGKYYLVTGKSAYPYISDIAAQINEKVGGMLHPIKVENDFYGNSVTVMGLLTGADVIKELLNHRRLDGVIVGESFLNTEKITLDDLSVSELEEGLGMKVSVLPVDGREIIKGIKELIECQNR